MPRILVIVGFACAAIWGASKASADCAPFHEPLESAAGVAAHGGGILGPVAFPAAVNGNGAEFNGAARMFFQNPAWAQAVRGSLSLWFRKNSGDVSGGIAQIGVIGSPGSLGLFYDNGSLIFELRASDTVTAAVGAALAPDEWTHVVAAWGPATGGTSLWLYVNGRYVGYGLLPAAFVPANNQLELGSTGFYGRGEGVIDEVRVFDHPLLDNEVYAEYVYSGLRFRRQAGTRPASTGPVRIEGGRLYVEGKPFRVKGVGYQPTPVGLWPSSDIYFSPAILARDMPILRGLNVNTIRLWGNAPNSVLLDACYNGGVKPIRVIMAYWVPQEAQVDYGDPATRAGIVAGYRAYVRQYKNHPAVLGWGLGNEVNLTYTHTMRDWYALANELAAAGHDEEGAAYHPAIIINGGLMDLGDVAQGSDDLSIPDIDVWGMNLYFGLAPECHFDYYDMLSAKPLLVTEYGIDAWDNVAGAVYESVHAQYIVAQWRAIKERALGASLMAYSDEWWKAGTPGIHDFGGYGTPAHPDVYSNEEWWGLLAAQHAATGPDVLTPRAAYYALSAEYADRNGDHDGDGDCDLSDYAALQRCRGAAGAACAGFDFVPDGVIDSGDIAGFTACLAGAAKMSSCAP